jgi:hypothetical protein
MSEADPLAPADPIESAGPPERVNYATGVLLDAQDFRDEQSYHRGRQAAALKAVGGFGTLAGLRVTPPADSDGELELRVEPGLALDRYGRLIQLDNPQCIRLARWFAAQGTPLLRAAVQRKPRTALDVAVVADVFLSVLSCARGKTPAFASGPFDALDAVVPSRIGELGSLELVPRLEGPADPAHPEADPIPVPKNFWPAATASDADKLAAVLGSWEAPGDQGYDPLQEHVGGHDPAAVLLARIAIPVILDANADAAVPPMLDLTRRVQADNSLRPFIFLPGKWLGRAFDVKPLIQP